MEIKAFSSGNFAGLKDVNIEFQPGLNVILGPNESGKSTLVEGIFASLFVEPKVKQSTTAGREFLYRFMPRPGGDSIDGKFVFSTEEGDFKLLKEWGSDQRVELTGPDGIKVKDGEAVRDQLGDILIYGESTYENLVFAKQRDMKNALARILSHPELTKEIKDVLHMALMEMGGISVDEIEGRLEAQMNKLYSRWDREKNHPEKNRGISDPWQTNVGLIVESYYRKEELRLNMEKAEAAELDFEKTSEEFKKKEEEYGLADKEKQDLEAIEDSVNQRAIIGLKFEGLELEEKALLEANESWPKIEVELLQNEEKLKAIGRDKEEIELKQGKLKKYELVAELKARLEKLNEIDGVKKEKDRDLSALAKVEQGHVNRLGELNKALIKLEAGLKGRDLEAQIKSTGDKSIFISKDLEDRMLLSEKDRAEGIKAGSYLKVEYGKELEIEIKASALDIDKIKAQYQDNQEKLKELLGELKLNSEEEVRAVLDKRKEITGALEMLAKEEALILKGDSREEIENVLKDSDKDKVAETSEDLDLAMKKATEEEIDLKSRIKAANDKITQWLDKYGNKGNLLILLAEKLNDKKDLEKTLAGLTPLPEEFNNPEEFNSRLRQLRTSLISGSETVNRLREEFYQAKSNLMEESFEEYRAAYKEAMEEFDKNLHKGEKLQLIEKAFYETKDRMTKNPMEGLVADFSKLLEYLTLGRYQKGEIDEDFNMSLDMGKGGAGGTGGGGGGEIPLELLSSGTYDAVVLALRLALMKHFFKDGNSFMVLDDCFVDLDPERKEAAAKMIGEFAKDFQIIFTTCHPETARLLGGNLINLMVQ